MTPTTRPPEVERPGIDTDEPLQKTHDSTVNTMDRVAGESVDVPGHWADVSDRRLPALLEDGTILMSSDMRTDPVEGTQGSYTVLDPDETCPECGLTGYVETTVHTLAGEAFKSCRICGHDGDDRHF